MKTKLVPLVANVAQTYAARRLAPDEWFEATPANAKLLKAIGRAKDAPAEVPAIRQPVRVPVAPAPAYEAQRRYRRRDLEEKTEDEEEVRPKRQYRRRDMSAEE